jgi:hypothetical protein
MKKISWEYYSSVMKLTYNQEEVQVNKKIKSWVLLLGIMTFGMQFSDMVYAFNFEIGNDIRGSIITNIITGTAIRTQAPSCSLTGDPNYCGNADTAIWSNGDDGNLNYGKYEPFSAYVSLTSELLLTMPSIKSKFMARGTGFFDFAVDNTDRTELSKAAYDEAARDFRLLDLWGEKTFNIGNQSLSTRIGNQVINWGESYFAFGGINATNALDYQKLLIPGTLLKQVILPAPMIKIASGLPSGFSTEAYYQAYWEKNKYPAVGTFWSASDILGKGAVPMSISTLNFNVSGFDGAMIAGPNSKDGSYYRAVNQNLLNQEYNDEPYYAYGMDVYEKDPDKWNPQYGFRLGYQPSGRSINFGLYYMNYTDKSPVISYLANGSAEWSYLENRDLFGISTNFPIKDWAIGAELSYRPNDAVSMTGAFLPDGPPDANTNGAAGIDVEAWKDMEKYQLSINAQLYMFASTNPIVRLLGGDLGVFTTEFTAIKYPSVDKNKRYTRVIDGVEVYQLPAAGYVTWLTYDNDLGYRIATGGGSDLSTGITLDFNVTYDNKIIPGWQVTPGASYSWAISGETPNFSANYMEGAQSIYFYNYFTKNASDWQIGLTYAVFFGGDRYRQFYGDRDHIGAFIKYTF